MGATIDNYRSAMHNQETRVCLAAASAAMLWRHPLFSGSARDRARMPTVRIEDFTVNYSTDTRSFTVSGRLRSDYGAHTVIIADDSPGKEDYWRMAYLGKISADGIFQVSVDEPGTSTGYLRTLFCFDNGTATGDGERHGLAGAMITRYRCIKGVYEFERYTASNGQPQSN
jgi:hypothetical protein